MHVPSMSLNKRRATRVFIQGYMGSWDSKIKTTCIPPVCLTCKDVDQNSTYSKLTSSFKSNRKSRQVN